VSVDRLPIFEIWSNPGWQTVWKSSNQIIAEVGLNLMQTGNDFSSNIGVDKFFGKFEMFSKDIELPALKTEKEGRKE